MKQLINLYLLVFTCILYSQEHIQIELHQDFKLGFIGDNRGNEPFTPDFKIGVALQGKQFKYYYFEVKPQFEYAELDGGKYVTWLINTGWIFNQFALQNIEAGCYLTAGMIHRWNESHATYGITLEINYRVLKRLKIGLMDQIIKRNDLKSRWDSDKFVQSFYIGLKYEIR